MILSYKWEWYYNHQEAFDFELDYKDMQKVARKIGQLQHKTKEIEEIIENDTLEPFLEENIDYVRDYFENQAKIQAKEEMQ